MPKPLNNPLSEAMDKMIRDPEVLGKMKEVLDRAEAAGKVSAQEATVRRRQIEEIEREMESDAPSN